MNIPLIIVLLYIALLFGISLHVAKKQKKDGASFLLYKGKNNTLVVAASIAGLALVVHQQLELQKMLFL